MNRDKDNSLSAKDLMLRGDPLLRFIYRWNIWPVMVILIILAYDSLYSIILPLLQGTFNQVFRDWPGLLRSLATTPLLLAYYSWQPRTIQQLYEEVEKRSQALSDKEAIQLSLLLRPLGYQIWAWLGAAFGIFQAVIFYFALSHGPANWQNSNNLILLMSTLMTFIWFYGVFQMVVRQVIAMIGINRFFRLIHIEISPIHPDRAGGLKPLGQYAVTIGLGLGVIGLALGISILRSHMGLEQLGTAFYLNLGLYLISAPFFFFIPLMEAHNLMQKAKAKVLLDVAEQYESVFQISLDKMKAGGPVDKELTQLDSIRKMYTIADASPEWPFNINMLSKFSEAVVLPVILPNVINYLSDFVKNLLGIQMRLGREILFCTMRRDHGWMRCLS